MPWCTYKETFGKKCTIGWMIEPSFARLVWDEPEPLELQSVQVNSLIETYCVFNKNDLKSRHFIVRCPFELNIEYEMRSDGTHHLKDLMGIKSSINDNIFKKYCRVIGAERWRHPDRPIIQVTAPYRFLSDDKVYLSQLPPYFDDNNSKWPGILIGERFPIDIWPRLLVWEFEWHDLNEPLVIKKGDPWFMVLIETDGLNSQIRLVEARVNSEISEYLEKIKGVSELVNMSSVEYELARKCRPKRMLIPKKEARLKKY